MLVSVIIPTWNEEHWLSDTLDSVTIQPGPWEIIVCDGGSNDRTRQMADPVATVVSAAKGRAQQMNAGARLASGDILLFLHADTRLSPGALTAIRSALADPSVQSGVFRLRFDRRGFWPSLFALGARIRWHRIAFGDRGLFVRRTAFEAIGGFADVPILEDLDLVCQLHGHGNFVYLRCPITTAWRRFAHMGALRQQVLNLRVWLQYVLGKPPHKIRVRYPPFNQMPQRV